MILPGDQSHDGCVPDHNDKTEPKPNPSGEPGEKWRVQGKIVFIVELESHDAKDAEDAVKCVREMLASLPLKVTLGDVPLEVKSISPS